MMTSKQKLAGLLNGKQLPEPEFNADMLTHAERKNLRVLYRKVEASGMDSLTNDELDQLQDLIEKGKA